MAPSPIPERQPAESPAPLDERLVRSASPGTPVTPRLQEELSRLSTRTRNEVAGRRRTGRFRVSRGAAVGLAALVFLGGGAAAVAVVEIRSYWAAIDAEPHAHYSFELPSGAECEFELRMMSLGPPGVENVGDFSMTDEQEEFAREMYSDAQERVDDFVTTDEFQEEVAHQAEVSGHEELSEDAIYFHAVVSMLDHQLHDDYRDAMQEIRVGGAAMGHSCPGADFEGSGLDVYGDMDAHEAEHEDSGG
ncbi:hypothetical protein [Nesterenkonia muleiensis]|uniref:hypothetical protein n=1 Tax=Nesterenkonia muleiensis TaxID=2282648 RepID=UPI000E7555E7|nr:hypothetical protein [Nesterenkonia muleiensis]